MDQWEVSDGHPPLLRRDPSHASIRQQQILSKPARYIIPKENIRLGQLISSGDFAEVYQGIWTTVQGAAVSMLADLFTYIISPVRIQRGKNITLKKVKQKKIHNHHPGRLFFQHGSWVRHFFPKVSAWK